MRWWSSCASMWSRRESWLGRMKGDDGLRGKAHGLQPVGLMPNTLFPFQFLDHLRDQGRLLLLHEMVDACLRHAELLHRRRRRFPGAFELLALGQVQIADQLRQALLLERILVVVIALDDLLLVGGVFAHGVLRKSAGQGRRPTA